jgi:hypothetical protein
MPIPSGGFEFERRDFITRKNTWCGGLISLQALGSISLAFELDAKRCCAARVETLRGPIGKTNREYE